MVPSQPEEVLNSCEYCGADKARTQNDIGQYFCGSSYSGHFTPRWMRSKECMESEIKQLRHQLDIWKTQQNHNTTPTVQSNP